MKYNEKQKEFKEENLNGSNKKKDEMVKKRGTTPFEELKSQKIFSIIMILAGLLLMFVAAPFIIIKIGTLVVVSGIVGVILFFVGLFYFLDVFFN